MKLIVDTDITLEKNDESLDIFKNCTVLYREDGNKIIIIPQKITLYNEIDINSVLSTIYYNEIGTSMVSYCPEGIGCGMKLRIKDTFYESNG